MDFETRVNFMKAVLLLRTENLKAAFVKLPLYGMILHVHMN